MKKHIKNIDDLLQQSHVLNTSALLEIKGGSDIPIIEIKTTMRGTYSETFDR